MEDGSFVSCINNSDASFGGKLIQLNKTNFCNEQSMGVSSRILRLDTVFARNFITSYQ